ncbi:MAG: reductive dehalogenase [Deltaproteobacteria bacterium]|jgi:reductive dehalogenase|nr:reductive dehalogenase [Deltaproteobacteria bacterium]
MSAVKKRKEKFQKELEFSRREFLGGAGILAASAALVNLKGMRGEARAANEITAQLPERYGSAHINYVPATEKNLGTTRIVGPIKQRRQAEDGFFRAVSGEFGEQSARNYFFHFVNKHPLSHALFKTLGHMAADNVVGGEPAPEKLPIPDPERMSRHIKELGFFLRADDVGIGVMQHHASYSERFLAHPTPEGKIDISTPVEDNSHHKYVIAVLIDQDLRTMLGSTGYDGISASQSFRSYATSGFIAVIMADYIRMLGYNARAHHAENYNMILAPNLIAAGMGEHSRACDCVMHPRLGYRTKAAVVSTDLPLVPDTPIDFGGMEFCRRCKKCAEECPSKALSFETEQSEYNGYMCWPGDMAKCTLFRINNPQGVSCGRCMKVCPWNNKEDSFIHSGGLQLAGRVPGADGLLKDVDDMLGYGTEQIEEFKWWLDWPEMYK